MKVTITQQDCNTADYLDVFDCPLARVLKRSGCKRVVVGGRTLNVGRKCYEFDTQAWNESEFIKLSISRDSDSYVIVNIPGLELSERKSSKNVY